MNFFSNNLFIYFFSSTLQEPFCTDHAPSTRSIRNYISFCGGNLSVYLKKKHPQTLQPPVFNPAHSSAQPPYVSKSHDMLFYPSTCPKLDEQTTTPTP